MKKPILVLLFCLLGISGIYASSRLQFRNIGFTEGLKNMNISGITQDKLGYIWVATMGGVSRYNGYEFRHFFFDSNDSTSLSSNHVSSVFCASDGLIYIGTAVGLDYYDNRIGKMVKPFPELKCVVLKIIEYSGYIYLGTNTGLFRFNVDNRKLEKLGSNLAEDLVISNLYFDRSGSLWCALDHGRGLALYDPSTDRYDIFKNTVHVPSANYNTIRTIFRVSEDIVLLGTKGGISIFDLKRKEFLETSEFSLLTSSLAGHDVRFILEKEPSVFWIGTLQAGFFIFDKSRNVVNRFFADDEFAEIHSNNYMNCFTDKTGNVWVGTFDAGIDVWFKQSRNFNFDVSLNNLTRDKFVTSINSDKKGNLVITTRENGFWIYNQETKSSKLYTTGNSELSHNNIRKVLIDSEGRYWLGTYSQLQIFYPSTGTFRTVRMPEPNLGAVWFIQEGDRIFVGTDGQGLLVLDLDGNIIKHFLAQGINIPMIIRLNDDELFFCSYGNGLFAIDINTYAVRRIELADTEKYPGLLFAMTAFMDKQGVVWVGTYNYGLFAFDFKKSMVRNICIRDGLPSTDAIGIQEDEYSNLWVSTSFGLAKINTNDFSVKTYSTSEGVNNYQFHGKASHIDKHGIIYFGGNSGLTYFNPSEILIEPADAHHLVFENLYVQNLAVTPSDKKSILTHSLPYTQQITLTHKDQVFSIDFVSFDYLSPEKVQYFYKLEGFDKDWYNIGTQRRVTYSNLPRGKYVFRARSVNHAGVKSENEAEFMIKVRPAPWYSYSAWAFYLSVIAIVSYLVFRLRIKAYLYKKNLEIEHAEHLRETEINVMKQKFVTNISHELRTPLTLIYGLVTQLSAQEKLNPKVEEFVQSLNNNVNRLLKLINQLLAFKKFEGETLSLWLEKRSINEAIDQIVHLFKVYAKEKEIVIDFQEDNNLEFCFDYDKLEKILSNLLANAVKHSENGGRIEISAGKLSHEMASSIYGFNFDKRVASWVEICVTDHGHGIDEKDWGTIFERYKQIEVNGKQRPDYSGTGIGLNFTKALVELHKGKIRMKSKIGKGTTFAFVLPFDPVVFEPRDFACSSPVDEVISPIKNVSLSESVNPEGTEVKECLDQTILIVEDDPQLNGFLTNALNSYYKTLSAYNGEAGLRMVKQKLPDLIVSDIMMPKMDGFELTKAIKEDNELCHIPIILLTAKTENESQIEGMHSGADLYVVKPFNIDFLLAAIDGQLKNRKRLYEIFFNGQMPQPGKAEINQLDFQFLTRLTQFLEKELSNPQLDIQLLAESMNMSRSAFYRKFMGLTKLSPISYIKKYRINKSVELIHSGNFSLTEISEMTGFGSPSYFSTVFRQEQGVSPREFLNQMKENKVYG
jgi:signal transduction histidine kinase/ligand-binding sensor domain-containing protein/DNA-binding response OmpR family regulator